MKLLYSPASPFVAYCRMASRHLEADIADVLVDAHNADPQLLAANPLGKIPCLITEDGGALFDSRVITAYLDAKAGGRLYADDNNFSIRRTEALCIGICDCAVAYQYELRLRPEEKWHQPWLDKQWGKVVSGLDAVQEDLPPSGTSLNAGSLSLAAALGYLDLRFDGKWQEDHSALVDWQRDFNSSHPNLAELKPSA